MQTETILAPINEAAERSAGLITEAQQRAQAITDPASYQVAADLNANIKRAIKHLEDVGSPLVKKTWEAYKEAKGLLDARLKPLQQAESIIKVGMRTYDDKVAAEQARIEAENRRIKEAYDRAERERIQKQQEAEAKRKRDEDEALEKAMEAETAGKKTEADAILASVQPPPVAPPPPPPPPVVKEVPLRPAATGVSYRDNWKAEVNDLTLLVKAVAEGKASIDYLLPNTVMLNALAKNKKEAMAIPGVRAWNDRVVSQRV